MDNRSFLNVLVRGMALLKKYIYIYIEFIEINKHKKKLQILQRPTLWIYLSLNWHIRHHAVPSAIIFVKESC